MNKYFNEKLQYIIQQFKNNYYFFNGCNETDDYIRILKLHENAQLNDSDFNKLKIFYFINLALIFNKHYIPEKYIKLHDYLDTNSNNDFFYNNDYFFEVIKNYYYMVMESIYESYEKIFIEQLQKNDLVNSSFTNDATTNDAIRVKIFNYINNISNHDDDNDDNDFSYVLHLGFRYNSNVKMVGPIILLNNNNFILRDCHDYKYHENQTLINIDLSTKRDVSDRSTRTLAYYGDFVFACSSKTIDTINGLNDRKILKILTKLLVDYNYQLISNRSLKNPIGINIKNPIKVLNFIGLYTEITSDSILLDSFHKNFNDFTSLSEVIESDFEVFSNYKYFPIFDGLLKAYPKENVKIYDTFKKLVNSTIKYNDYDQNYILYDMFFYVCCSLDNIQPLEVLLFFIKSLDKIFICTPTTIPYLIKAKEKDDFKFLKLIQLIYTGNFDFNIPTDWQLELL